MRIGLLYGRYHPAQRGNCGGSGPFLNHSIAWGRPPVKQAIAIEKRRPPSSELRLVGPWAYHKNKCGNGGRKPWPRRRGMVHSRTRTAALPRTTACAGGVPDLPHGTPPAPHCYMHPRCATVQRSYATPKCPARDRLNREQDRDAPPLMKCCATTGAWLPELSRYTVATSSASIPPENDWFR